MLSDDLMVFTNKGFKQLKMLDIGDKVLSFTGLWVRVLNIGERGYCDKIVYYSTGDCVICSDDKNIIYNHKLKIGYSEEPLKDIADKINYDKFGLYCTYPFKGYKQLPGKLIHKDLHELYRLGFRGDMIPKDIEKYGHDERMNIIAGIFDSARSVRCDDFVLVNCGTSLEYLTKFISLIRSFGYGAQIIFGKEMRVKVYVSKTFGELPQKVLTPPIPYVDTLDKVFIEKVEETFAIPGRKIYVERNSPILVGYGFIPIRP